MDVKFDINGVDGKTCFKMYENGEFKFRETMITKHPNVLKSVLTSKKGWGLWVKEWSEGISDGLFTKEEILNEFVSKGIDLPDSFKKELDDSIQRKKYKVL